MRVLAVLRQRLVRVRRDERGFTLVEIAMAGLLGTILLGGLASFLIGAMNTGSFTQGHSARLNDARNAMQGMEREVRGADSIQWCDGTGSCLQIGAQTPTGTFVTLRYTYADGELRKEEFDSGTATWSAPKVVVDRLTNTGEQPVFACDTQSTLLRVTIDLHIEPTPQSDPSLNLQTSIRPRNFPSVASCP